MRNRAGQLIILAAVLVLTGCPGNVRTPPPKAEVVELPVRQYVDVPAELLKRCEWPKDWPKRKVLESNRLRGACLEQYEGQFDSIGKLRQTK